MCASPVGLTSSTISTSSSSSSSSSSVTQRTQAIPTSTTTTATINSLAPTVIMNDACSHNLKPIIVGATILEMKQAVSLDLSEETIKPISEKLALSSEELALLNSIFTNHHRSIYKKIELISLLSFDLYMDVEEYLKTHQ